MPYADPDVRKQKDKEYKSRPEVMERNRALYRKRYEENQNNLADKVKSKHYERWQSPEYRAMKTKRYHERWEENWSKQKVVQIKARAKKQGLDFDIDENDIPLPEKCPIFGIPLKKNIGKQTNDSPSVDRIDPRKGYVKGNVVVVSTKANSIKRESTIEELKKMVEFYETLIKDQNDG